MKGVSTHNSTLGTHYSQVALYVQRNLRPVERRQTTRTTPDALRKKKQCAMSSPER